jgi:N-acyl-D-amino-acid deacylase
MRGALRPGYYADIAIFDYDTIIDRATYEQPSLSPLGIKYVLVNGELTINNGSYTAKKAGRVIRFNQPENADGWLLR